MMFIKAYRRENTEGEQVERQKWHDYIGQAFKNHFRIERVADTCIDPDNGSRPETALPGIVFWMTRIK
jgi:hypothetical protein